jgi:hypothetical protein
VSRFGAPPTPRDSVDRETIEPRRHVSDEQFDESAAVPSDERAAEQFRRELDALRRKYEELGLDFDAALEEHLARKPRDS